MSNQARVVQGIAVQSPYEGSGMADASAVQPVGEYNGSKGEKQPTGCRDIAFAILFYLQLGAMVVCAIVYGPAAFGSYQFQDAGITVNAADYITIAAICGVLSFILSGGMLLVMMVIASCLIKTAMIFTMALYIAFTVLAFASGNIIGGVVGALLCALFACYIWAAWSRIPFATANLVTSLTAVKANFGVAFIGYFFAVLSLAWFFLWAIVFVGVFIQTSCDANGVCQENFNPGYLFLLFLSFYFTAQVLQNCVHVTVAGTVGSWWFSPEGSSCCCNGAIIGSWFRAMTTSFGSICFGSLLVAILQALRQLANSMRNGDNGILICIADCILGCLQSLLEYFNKWAYIYVGLYGYSYLEAGKNVMTLFQNRGWEAIIADDLVGMTLFMVSLVVGLVTGAVAAALVAVTDIFADLQGDNTSWIAFVFGLMVGLVVTSVLMSVIGSGVNTVIVCFAEGPAEFQQNHPKLSQKMREAWSKAYPGSLS